MSDDARGEVAHVYMSGVQQASVKNSFFEQNTSTNDDDDNDGNAAAAADESTTHILQHNAHCT